MTATRKISPVKSDKKADEYAAEHLELTAKVEKVEADYDKKIADLVQKRDAAIAEDQARADLLFNAIEAWFKSDQRKAKLVQDGGRTVKLTHATVKYIAGCETIQLQPDVESDADVIARINRKPSLNDFNLVVTKQSLSKPALKGLNDKQLKSVGLHRVTGEESVKIEIKADANK